jgi:malate permease and related proteins
MTFANLLSAIIAILGVYLITLWLRRRGVLREEHSAVLAKLITDVCLPAMIFTSLASQSIRAEQLKPVFLMLAADLVILLAAWAFALLAKMDRSSQGAVVFCATLGSSALLGYSIIMQVYPGQPAPLEEAVLISELAVGLPLFTIAPLLAAWFGQSEGGLRGAARASVAFFTSPVFFALATGILWSVFDLPGKSNPYMEPIMHLGSILAGALTPLAIITVGLMLKIPKIRHVIWPLVVVLMLKLLAKPLLLGFSAMAVGFPRDWRDILVILSAMPSAALGVVYLRRYNADAGLAATFVLTSTIVSLGTILLVFYWVG